MRWTIEQVAGALASTPSPGLNPLARLAGVSIDSRKIRAGELFIAIHGPRHDGHSFVTTALEAGALAAVVARERLAEYPDTIRERLLPVDDTLVSLQHLARAVRRSWGRRLAAVTGSMGKTTTKEILAALLATRFRILKSEGNLNNEYGLPLTLLRLEESDQAGVVELGMSHRGEIARLAEIAEPDIGIVTRVAPVHMEFFSSLDQVALAKRELIEGLKGTQTLAVLNADDEAVANFAKIASGRVVTFGFSSAAEFRAENIEDRGADGTAFDFTSPTGRARLELPLVGRHNISNAVAALAAASAWGIGIIEARRVFPQLGATTMRGEVLRFESGFTVVNDSYNSNPVAFDAMVDLLASTAGFRRCILVAGEMLELGSGAPEYHRQAGRRAHSTGRVDWIIGVQGEAASLVNGAVEAGHPDSQTRFFASSEEAARFVADLVALGDLLLVKGSRGVKMERIVEALKARHALAGEMAGTSANPRTNNRVRRERG